MAEHSDELPNLRHLRLFLLASETSSLRAASRAMRLSQPAASLCLAGLERRFGACLFERRANGLLRTEAGTVLARRVARCFGYLLRAAIKAADREEMTEHGIEQIAARLTVTQLRCMVAVADRGNITGAAISLGVRPASVHRAIGELEREIGAVLMDRKHGRASANATGRDVATLFNLGLEELISAAHDINDLNGLLKGRVAVGAVRVTAAGVLAEAIMRLSREAPEARFSVMQDEYEVMFQQLRAGKLDYVCSTIRPNVPRDLIGEELCDSEVCIICGPHHPLVGRSDITAAELARFPWIGYHPMTGAAVRMREMFQAEGVPPPPLMVETIMQDLIRSLLMGGNFLAVATRSDVVRDHGLGMLPVLNKHIPGGRRTIWLLWRRDWNPTRLQRRLADVLRTIVAEAKNDRDQGLQVEPPQL